MTGLVEYLRARIAEDEAAARAADWGESWAEHRWQFASSNDRRAMIDFNERIRDHIARWDPARVLAECAAKLAIIDRHDRLTGAGGVYRDGVPCQMCWPARCELHLFAQPYAGRDDFNPAWRMEAGQ
jgi:hypothetical protein